MKILILGAGAGGGFPQWNCHCDNCRGVRDGSIKATPRTQSSIAVSANGTDWVLINASPDLRQQINHTPETDSIECWFCSQRKIIRLTYGREKCDFEKKDRALKIAGKASFLINIIPHPCRFLQNLSIGG